MKQFPSIPRLANAPDRLFETGHIWLLEKVDGANVRFQLQESGLIVVGDRSRVYDDPDAIPTPYRHAVRHIRENLDRQALRRAVDDPTEIVFFGEAMHHHTIEYDWQRTPSFLGFDVWSTSKQQFYPFDAVERIFERLGLTPWLPRAMAAGALLAAGGGVVVTGSVVGGAVADSPGGGFTVGQTGATVLWLTTAAALLLRGLRGSSVAVPAGLTITGLALIKLVFFDLAFLDGVPRVLSFIVGGLIVLGTGAGYARALERSREEPVDNSTPDDAPRPTV